MNKKISTVIFGMFLFGIISLMGVFAQSEGCCAMTDGGVACAVVPSNNCSEGADYLFGVECYSSTFCQKGCCYNDLTGIYDQNVLEADCNMDWVADPNCNLPGADLGCCVLENQVIYETYGQCAVDTLERAMGSDSVIDWRDNVGESECIALAYADEKGACVLGGGSCRYITGESCSSIGGDMYLGRLCTATDLETNCEPTEETTCVEGKMEVYFLDSCGNVANIYDSSKANVQSYWEVPISSSQSCGANSGNGNANSPSCGNCDLFAGGICASATQDNFNVNMGNYYCRDVSCEDDEGEKYENGESWCGYDGKIGEGDDVVGSRHWSYVCNLGRIDVESCSDYRGQICVQSNVDEINGEVFRHAGCVTNTWRSCLALNSEEDVDERVEQCHNLENCRVEEVDIASHFKLKVCTPRYPGGFDYSDEESMEDAEAVCGLATKRCEIPRKRRWTGSCKIVANRNCLNAGFGEKMNDYCRRLGDCGGEVNILGEYTKNHKITGSPQLSSLIIESLIDLANEVPGQFAQFGSYDDYILSGGYIGGAWTTKNNPIDEWIHSQAIGLGDLGHWTNLWNWIWGKCSSRYGS